MELFSNISMIQIVFFVMAAAPLITFTLLALYSLYTLILTPVLAWWLAKTWKAYQTYTEQKKGTTDV